MSVHQEVRVTRGAQRVLAQPWGFTEADQARVELRRQWVIQPVRAALPRAGWIRRPLGGSMSLVHHPETRVEQIGSDDEGVTIVGIAVLPDEPARAACNLFATPETRTHEAIVRSLRRMGGTYAVIRHDARDVRVYTDPGMMGVYYCDGHAASTPALLPGLRRNVAIDRVFRLGGGNEWYPGALTPFVGVRALLANHRLCVRSGQMQRFWPLEEPTERPVDESIDRVCEILRGMMLGVSKRGRVLMGLTGGRDSRTVLSAAKPVIGECDVFTLRSGHTESGDVEHPAAMAGRFDLRHSFVDVTPPQLWLLRLYDEMTCGMAVGASRQVVDASRRLSAPGRIHVNGALGELAMPYYWHSANPKSVRLKSLAKKQASKPAVVMDAVREWRESVGDLKATTIYNLMHLEQLGGRWWSAVETAGNLFYESFTPFCHRDLFECLCALPPRMVFENGLRAEFVRRLWPELLEVPYCRASKRLSAYVPRGIKERAKWIVDREHRMARRADRELPEVVTIAGERRAQAA